MRRFTIRFVWMVVIAALVVGCGRRLPDEYFETNTSVTESDTSAEVADALDAEDTAEDADATSDEASEDAEMADTDADIEEAPEATEMADTDEDASADAESVVEEDAEPEMVLVEVPADPIVELVANADPVNGETLFNSGVTCTSCHLVESEDRLVGPGLLDIPQRAETRVEGEIAERYLYNAIILPNDHVVEGYPAAMYASYPDDYTEEEIYDIVAYLMTLGDYPDREPVFMEVAADDVEGAETVAEDTEEVADDIADAEADAETDDMADAETDDADTDTEDAEVTPEVVYIVVTATPSAETIADDDTTEETVADTDTEDDTADAETDDDTVDDNESMADATFEPSYTLDFADVPQTINALAQYGSVSAGETLFSESCASCHTIDGTGESDLSMVGSIEDAPSYIWAATYSTDVHGELATDFAGEISAADAAHLVAYLLSQSDMQTDE
ncbi:MAG: c-type cytochrome [Chloroflexota bacterium]